MSLYEQLKAPNLTTKDKCRLILMHYASRKLQSALEPSWEPVACEALQKYLDGGGRKTLDLVKHIIESHSMKDGTVVEAYPGFPGSPKRIMDDGLKIGTPTWVFMGRCFGDAASDLGNGWVCVSREVPGSLKRIWIAYHRNKQMGMTARTSNVFGPCDTRTELISAMKKKGVLAS